MPHPGWPFFLAVNRRELDFGIAKLLETEATTPESNPTMTLNAMMTPEYASPEPVRGEAITMASDVYSLGVVLFELLTGQRPYVATGRRPDELARAICEQEPPRPSTVAGKAGPTDRTAGQAGVSRALPAQWSRRLAGDLDTIVAKALRKEPARRYASIGQFSDDIRRHGEGLPVRARRDTLGYRFGKFVRRNKTAVAAVVVLGIVTSNSILIVEFTHRLIEDGMSVRAAVWVRLRPVLMTSLATLMGLIPRALKPGEGSESYAPLARSIIGGLAASVVLTVFIVPAAFLLVHGRRERHETKPTPRPVPVLEPAGHA